MNNLLILLAQTKSEATIEIISLLVVAGIIGYVTAWLYTKSVYGKKLEAVESDKHELNNRIVNLDAEIFNLKKNLEEKNIEIIQLVMDCKAMVHVAQRKHLLNYESFGTATEAEKDDLRMISGIGLVNEASLNALDIYTFRQISKFTSQDQWVEQAIELEHRNDMRSDLFKRISERKSNIQYNRIGIAHKDEADDLTIISGIGGWIKEKLNALDIYTFRQISNFTEEDVKAVTEAIEYFPGRIERDEWILQAQELVRIAGNKSELLKRIRDRQGRIYFDRLGIAHRHEANNLTLIDGLGLWVEERLNLLGIYTFDQISKLTHEDIETITEVLEIIPGRIERDNWVGQARELAKNHLYHEAS
jgi:predicted flap endonuclease-1-like 5' DNA nuclease